MSAAGERDDAALVAAALAGDNSAYSALMARHKPALYRFVRRYVGDDDESFDLTQEALVACWLALDRFDRSRRFDVWLKRIALNKCRDWSRRRRVRAFFFAAASLDLAPDTPAVSASNPVDPRLTQLDAAIAALPDTLKAPLLLTVFEQMSHDEAAAMLGVSAKAIETRIYRAKQHLRAALSGAPGA